MHCDNGDVPDEPVFRANLKLHPYISFNQKLNFGLSEISDASFNVDFLKIKEEKIHPAKKFKSSESH